MINIRLRLLKFIHKRKFELNLTIEKHKNKIKIKIVQSISPNLLVYTGTN